MFDGMRLITGEYMQLKRLPRITLPTLLMNLLDSDATVSVCHFAMLSQTPFY